MHVSSRARNGRQGFTLIELLVVIGIIVILLAITVPIGMRLQAGNRLMACESNMHRLQQVMRMYRLDEGGFPPYWFEPGTNTIHGRGLLALKDLGYMKSDRVLECPMDSRDYPPGYGPTDFTIDAPVPYDAEDPLSYQWIDPDAVTATNIPAFRYETRRGVGAGDRDANRMPRDGQGTLYQPDDTTVLTYCPFHRKTITKGGRPQYLVLFYDGRVDQMDEALFRAGDTSTTPPEEAWRVWPGQTDWNSGAPAY
jgi:prepilin-type N-terminal cleavage/methylation domain-containing protein